MATADQAPDTSTFDPDEFMKSRGAAAAPATAFDPDEFMKQRQAGTTTAPKAPATSKPPQPESSTIGDLATGALKGVGHTLTGLSPLINKIPYIGETLAPSEGIRGWNQITEPKGTAQKVGYLGEQAAEYFLPAGLEEKAGALAARAIPQIGKAAPVLGRLAGSALTSGAVTGLQGGNVGTGAAIGAAGGGLGEVARAAAPSIAESALGVTQRMRGYGRTIGDTLLKETEGIRPATLAKEVPKTIGDLTNQMESAVHQASMNGVQGTTQPAHAALDAAIAKTPRNAHDLIDKLKSLRDVLSLSPVEEGQAPQLLHTPDELLEMKRGIDKTIKTWGPEWQKLDDVKRVKQGLYRAIDNELDKSVPGNAEINQRISSLIPASQAVRKAMSAAPLAQKLAGRVAAHTGALAGAGIGGTLGYREGGVPGAIAGGTVGLLAPEILASPTSQMLVARKGPGAIRALRALAGAGAAQATQAPVGIGAIPAGNPTPFGPAGPVTPNVAPQPPAAIPVARPAPLTAAPAVRPMVPPAEALKAILKDPNATEEQKVEAQKEIDALKPKK